MESKFKNNCNSKTDSGCWLWLKGKDRDGYGKIWYESKTQPAHRVAYRLYKGSIPKGMLVCHTCDTPSCVNPEHLFLGTNLDNMRDRTKKGRYRDQAGEKNPSARLTEQEVMEIRDMLKFSPFSQVEISYFYEVSANVTSKIKLDKTWVKI